MPKAQPFLAFCRISIEHFLRSILYKKNSAKAEFNYNYSLFIFHFLSYTVSIFIRFVFPLSPVITPPVITSLSPHLRGSICPAVFFAV